MPNVKLDYGLSSEPALSKIKIARVTATQSEFELVTFKLWSANDPAFKVQTYYQAKN